MFSTLFSCVPIVITITHILIKVFPKAINIINPTLIKHILWSHTVLCTHTHIS